jgi:hypothetical protein
MSDRLIDENERRTHANDREKGPARHRNTPSAPMLPAQAEFDVRGVPLHVRKADAKDFDRSIPLELDL